VAVADQIEEQGMRRLIVPRISAARPDLGVRPTWHQVVDYTLRFVSREVAAELVEALKSQRD
jgi:hypothetical protein